MSIGVVGAFTGLRGGTEAAPKVMHAWAETMNAAGLRAGDGAHCNINDLRHAVACASAWSETMIGYDHVEHFGLES